MGLGARDVSTYVEFWSIRKSKATRSVCIRHKPSNGKVRQNVCGIDVAEPRSLLPHYTGKSAHRVKVATGQRVDREDQTLLNQRCPCSRV